MNEVSCNSRPRASGIIALTVICGLTLWCFAPALSNALVDWDDYHLLVQNEAYRGLGAKELRWMFTTTLGGHYQPLTWLSYAVDYVLWGGVEPVGFHLTNIALHLVTSIGLFFVAKSLLRAALPEIAHAAIIAGALVATLLFAVHPLRVESVAWATERRDVLSGALLMPVILLYLSGAMASPGRFRRYILASLPIYASSLLSKAIGMTLPVILFLLDVYPLRRLSTGRSAPPKEPLPRLMLEKLPYVALAAACAAIGAIAQSQAGAMRTLGEHPFALRIGQAAYGILFYLGKMVWPANLIPLYEQDPTATGWEPRFLASIAGVIAITIILWRLRRKLPSVWIAWLSYIVLLSPVLGLAQSGPQIAADRYTYLASMPWAILVGGALARLWAKGRLAIGEQPRSVGNEERHLVLARPPYRIATTISFGAIILVFAGLTREQTLVWKDSYTLWTTVIERAPTTGTAHANLAALLNARGEHDQARDHAQMALERLPGNRVAHVALGRAALALGDFETAERHLIRAIDIAAVVGRTDTPTMVVLAAALTYQQKLDEAEAVYNQVLALEPDDPQWRFAYAGFLAGQVRFAESQRELEHILRINPHRPDVYFRLGVVRGRLGDFSGAIHALNAGMELDDSDINLRAELAWFLATCPQLELRDGPRALALARSADLDADGRSIRAKEALAAAYAETGHLAEAITTIEDFLAVSPPLAPPTEKRLRIQLEQLRSAAP